MTKGTRTENFPGPGHPLTIEEMLEHEGLLRLGAIIDADEAYLNGVLVGKTGYKYPPRKYPVPKGVLQAGKNILAVRVISNRETGGFVHDKTILDSVMGEKNLDNLI